MPFAADLYHTLETKRQSGEFGKKFDTLASMFSQSALKDIGEVNEAGVWSDAGVHNRSQWIAQTDAAEAEQALEAYYKKQKKALEYYARKNPNVQSVITNMSEVDLGALLFQHGALGTYRQLNTKQPPVVAQVNQLQNNLSQQQVLEPKKSEETAILTASASTQTPQSANTFNAPNKELPNQVEPTQTTVQNQNIDQTSSSLVADLPTKDTGDAERSQVSRGISSPRSGDAYFDNENNSLNLKNEKQNPADDPLTVVSLDFAPKNLEDENCVEDMPVSDAFASPSSEAITKLMEQAEADRQAFVNDYQSKNPKASLDLFLAAYSGQYRKLPEPDEVIGKQVTGIVPGLQMQGKVQLFNKTNIDDVAGSGSMARHDLNLIVAGNLRPHFNYRDGVLRYLLRTADVEWRMPIYKSDDESGQKNLLGQLSAWAGFKPVDNPYFRKKKLYDADLSVSCECTSSNYSSCSPLENKPTPNKNTTGLFYHEFNEASYTGFGLGFETKKLQTEIIFSPKGLPKLKSSAMDKWDVVSKMDAPALVVRADVKTSENSILISQVTKYGDVFRLQGVGRMYTHSGQSFAIGGTVGKYRNAFNDKNEKQWIVSAQAESAIPFAPQWQGAILASVGRLQEQNQTFYGLQLNIQSDHKDWFVQPNVSLGLDSRYGPSVFLGVNKTIQFKSKK